MSQQKIGDIITLKAADLSVPAYRIVGVDANGKADIPNTTTTALLGVTNNDASATNQAVGVIISGTAKCKCGASVGAGEVVGCQTSTGKCIEITDVAVTTTTAVPKAIGISLQAGSTNSVIEITVQPNNLSKDAYA